MLTLTRLFLLLLGFGLVCANTGDATFYTPGLGSCGIQNASTDLIAAVSKELYDTFPGATANPNSNPVCKKQITLTYQGKSVTVEAVDRCAGCPGKFDLDLSPAAFDKLAPPEAGRLKGVEWDFVGGPTKRELGGANEPVTNLAIGRAERLNPRYREPHWERKMVKRRRSAWD